MVRKDGLYSIYRIQRIGADKQWHYPNLDVFGYPDGFNASGDCWQITGIHGVFEKKKAIKGLKKLQSENKKDKFRMVLVIISQKTIIE
jgi:hypothetical protein